MKAYSTNIEKATLNNNYFRQVLFTSEHAQLVLMCLNPGEEIGNEVHEKVDQFFRIEQGEAKFIFNGVLRLSVLGFKDESFGLDEGLESEDPAMAGSVSKLIFLNPSSII